MREVGGGVATDPSYLVNARLYLALTNSFAFSQKDKMCQVRAE